jgi:hypothetical protein
MENKNVINTSKERLNILYDKARKEEFVNKEEALNLLKEANEIALNNIEVANYIQLSRLPNLLKKLGLVKESEIERKKISNAYKTFKQQKNKQQWDLLINKYQNNFSVEIKSGTIDNACSYHSSVFKMQLPGNQDTFNKYIATLSETDACKCWFIVSSKVFIKNSKENLIQNSTSINKSNALNISKEVNVIQKVEAQEKININFNKLSLLNTNEINNIENKNKELSNKIEQALSKAKTNLANFKAVENEQDKLKEKKEYNVKYENKSIYSNPYIKNSSINAFGSKDLASIPLQTIDNNINKNTTNTIQSSNNLDSLNITQNIKPISSNIYSNLNQVQNFKAELDLKENISIINIDNTEISNNTVDNDLTDNIKQDKITVELEVNNVSSLQENIVFNVSNNIINTESKEEVQENINIYNAHTSFNNLLSLLKKEQDVNRAIELELTKTIKEEQIKEDTKNLDIINNKSQDIKPYEIKEDLVLNQNNLPIIEELENKIEIPKILTEYKVDDENLSLISIPDVIIHLDEDLDDIKQEVINRDYIINNALIKQNNLEITTIEKKIDNNFNFIVNNTATINNSIKLEEKSSLINTILWYIFLLLIISIALVVNFKFL